MPGVTTGNALHREPGTVQGTVCFDGLDRVLRTRRIEAATRPQQWADGELVPANQIFQDVAHVVATRSQRVARLARSVVAGASRAENFAATTMSTAGRSNCARRKLSRIWRRSRLRATALPEVFTATASPIRGCARPLGFTRSAKKRSSMRRPPA